MDKNGQKPMEWDNDGFKCPADGKSKTGAFQYHSCAFHSKTNLCGKMYSEWWGEEEVILKGEKQERWEMYGEAKHHL